FGIERKRELLFPIEFVARITEGIVTVLRAGTMPSQIGGMGRDLVGDDSVLYIFFVGKPEVLLGSDIAEHGGAVPSDHRRADRRSNVVVARSDVSTQRAERIKRRFVAKLALFIHLLFNLVERDVARAFD